MVVGRAHSLKIILNINAIMRIVRIGGTGSVLR